jgi:hypothetical protein
MPPPPSGIKPVRWSGSDGRPPARNSRRKLDRRSAYGKITATPLVKTRGGVNLRVRCGMTAVDMVGQS